jgi:hypothetical protein
VYVYSVDDDEIVDVIGHTTVSGHVPHTLTTPSISRSGRFVAFDLDATALSAPHQTFLYDRGKLVGDLNGDGCVSEADLNILLFNWGTDCDCCAADLDGDDDVDEDDERILTSNYDCD